MTRVVIVQPYVPRYRVPLFAAMHSRLAALGIELEILAGRPDPDQAERGDATWDLPFQSTVTALSVSVGSRSLRWKSVLGATSGADLVVAELASGALENYALSMRRRPPVATWGHGYAATSDPHRIDEVLEHWLLQRSVHFFSYTDRGRQAAEAAGFPADRITVLDNTIDTSSLRGAVTSLEAGEVARYVEAHGLHPDRTVSYVGALDAPKRIEFLLDAADRIAERVPGFALLVGGDGRQRALVESRAADREWMHYLGRVDDHDKALLGACSSALLNPGRVGLVAIDSFVLGLPIVTTEWNRHAPEFAYLRDGVNGVVAPDSSAAFCDAVVNVLTDHERLALLQRNCLGEADHYTIEHMADRFASGIRRALVDAGLS